MEAQTREPYAYAGNNPLNYLDPSGLSWYDPRDWDQDIVDVGKEIIGHPGDAARDAAKGFGNFWVGFGNAALGTDFEGWCGEGQSWSRNIGSATFWAEMAVGHVGSAAVRAGWSGSFMRYRNAKGVGLSFYKDGTRMLSFDWHRFTLRGRTVNRPHVNYRTPNHGIGRHWPWT